VRAAPKLRAFALRLFPRYFARWFTPDARELGALGEEWAARALHRSGFEILGRRVRTSAAEIDIVAREGPVLVLVEVKTTRFASVPCPRGSALASTPPRFRADGRLGSVQAARLRRAAGSLLSGHRTRARVDLVEVFLDARSGAVRIEHRRGVAGERERRSRFTERDPNEST
jgi:putative endonuclease